MIYLIGYPSDVGGANTEVWHVLKLWRRAGWQVTAIPTWQAEGKWQARLARIGVETIVPERREFPVPPGSTCVAFCNGHFEQNAHKLRALGCRLIYVPCMCSLSKALVKDHQQHGPFDAYVFQSRAQENILLPQLSAWGVKQSTCHLIRGAFDWSEIEYRPRPRGEGFVVGRLSRADPAKFSRYTWDIFNRARRAIPELSVRVMGWRERVAQKTGLPPGWAEVLEPGAEPADRFLGTLHCLCQAADNHWDNPAATENWPRVGLEAMAAGVPIVAEKRGGWLEMVEHGKTGFLGTTVEELAGYCVELGQDEPKRLAMTGRAYERVKQFAEPDDIADGWREVLDGVAA